VRRIVLLATLAALALPLLAACDDDDAPSATSMPSATATTTVAATPTTGPDAAIAIDEPATGSTVAVPVEMTGTANVFEAVLIVDALNDSGVPVCRRRLMATSGTGTPGDWSGVLALPPPAEDAPITLRAYSFSAMDGSMINLVERSVIVSDESPDIVITSPGCDEEVSGATLVVEGTAQVFEAALVVEIRDEFGSVRLSQNVMAASGVELSPWSASFDVSTLVPGFYDVVAYSISAEDGSIINVFPVQISRVP
jgi:hypothetical protein